MTNTLLLSGASVNSSKWANALLKSLIESGIQASLFEYDHWKDGGEIDIEKEAKKLHELLAKNHDITNIVAKSAGSIVTMYAEQNTARELRNVFIGIPVEYAKERGIDIDSLVKESHTRTLCIQAESDPMGSYEQITNLILDNTFMITKRIKGNDHHYTDLDTLVDKIDIYLKASKS